MESTTHYALGALTTAAVAPPAGRLLGLDLSPAELAAGVAVGTLAGVLPDIDHPRSLITRGLLPLRGRGEGVALAVGQLLSIPPRLVGLFARSVFEHRGGTHSFAFLAVWAVLAAPLYAALACGLLVVVSRALAAGGAIAGSDDPLALDPGPAAGWIVAHTPEVMPLVALCVACGYLSHLVSDGMTSAPIRLFWPSRRKVWIAPEGMRTTTGSPVERYVIQPFAVLAAIAVIVLQVGVPLRDQLGGELQAHKPVRGVPCHHHGGHGCREGG